MPRELGAETRRPSFARNVAVPVLATVPSLRLTTTVPGKHTIHARAFDLAGNKIEVDADFTVSASSVTLKPVYRFRNLKTGYYLWSADENEKAIIIATLSKIWAYEGVAYQINTAHPANSSPLWRFTNVRGGFYLYSADSKEKSGIQANLSKT